MRSIVLFLALSLAALAFVPAAAGADGRVNANLDVGFFGAVPYKSCSVTVADGTNVGGLLDAAVAAGCLESWEAASFPGFGRYVTSIDGIPETAATYWAFYVDGAYSDYGIDDTTVLDGHTYEFQYEQWAVPV